MKQAIIIALCLLLTYTTQAQKNTKVPKTPYNCYYITLIYFDNKNEIHIIFSDIIDGVINNEDQEARIIDNFENGSDPFHYKKFVDRAVHKFPGYKRASDAKQLSISLLNNPAATVDEEKSTIQLIKHLGND